MAWLPEAQAVVMHDSGPLQAQLHRDLGRGHVGDHHRDEERRDAVRAALGDDLGLARRSVSRPPMPLPMSAPARAPSAVDRQRRRRPAARRPAATPSCAKRSIRRATRALDVVRRLEAARPRRRSWWRVSIGVEAGDRPRRRSARSPPRPSSPRGRCRASVTSPRPVTTTRRRAIAHDIDSPPSTDSTAPVTKAAAGEQRNATTPATSSGVPSRPSGRLGRAGRRAARR